MERKILVVEDSPTQAARVRFLLEEEGYYIEVARNGREGLQRVRSNPPDLIISDVVMPEMDGYTFCRLVKSCKGMRRIPFVLLTQQHAPEDILLGLEQGADNFITKPFENDYLLERVRRIFEHLEFRQRGAQEIEFTMRVGEREITLNADKQQIFELLFSTFEELNRVNAQLAESQRTVAEYARTLESKVRERTQALQENNRRLECMQEQIAQQSQQLWQAAKLATMGELAASIAHELNNPLATVSLRIESLLGEMGADEHAQETLRVVAEEVDRMGNLVANLLQFSRRSHQQVSTVDVQAEIQGTLELIHYHLRNHQITVRREFAREVPMVHADRQQLRQLFLNLVTNAADAMPQGGTLTIRVDNARPPSPAQVIIEVSDTGVGIAAEDLPKVLDPFFTTKPEGKGTGLGLAICRRIAQEHGGTLELSSEVGKGPTVRIIFPSANAAKTELFEEI
jgi:signal transduction histidine kinase